MMSAPNAAEGRGLVVEDSPVLAKDLGNKLVTLQDRILKAAVPRVSPSASLTM